MKKALKIVACLLIMMTVALGMNTSKAHAEVSVLCDRSANPTCSAILEPGESTAVPLEGYKLKNVEIDFPGGPVPAIYPPPTVNYKLDNENAQISGNIEPNVTAKYQFDTVQPRKGEVRNVDDKTASFSLPLEVVWKNIHDDSTVDSKECDLFPTGECEADLQNQEKFYVNDNRTKFSDLCILANNKDESLFSRLAVTADGNEYQPIRLQQSGPNPVLAQFKYMGRNKVWEIENKVREKIVSKMHVKVYGNLTAPNCFE